jgi:hypothetical protein
MRWCEMRELTYARVPAWLRIGMSPQAHVAQLALSYATPHCRTSEHLPTNSILAVYASSCRSLPLSNLFGDVSFHLLPSYVIIRRLSDYLCMKHRLPPFDDWLWKLQSLFC